MAQVITREEFWAGPLGIALIGLIVGVVVILCVRGLMKLARRPAKPAVMPPGVPRAKSLNYPEK